MFDKAEQRRRAAELSALNLAKGQKQVVLPPIQVSKSAAVKPASAWPFPLPLAERAAVSAKPAACAQVVTPSLQKEQRMSVKYLEEAFENEFGQSIPVGAKIIAVKQGYNHTIGISEGTYLGLRKDRSGKVKNVTVKLKCSQRGYFLPDGSAASANVVDATYGTGTVERRVTLPRMRIYPTV